MLCSLIGTNISEELIYETTQHDNLEAAEFIFMKRLILIYLTDFQNVCEFVSYNS
jgi:hypothetical protein